MAGSSRGGAAAIACLLAAALLWTGAQDASGAPTPEASPSLSGPERCREKAPRRMRCGRLQVPLERSEPGLGTISIRYAVVPRRRSDRPARGAILGIEGGPGYGSIASAADYVALFGKLLERRDLLVVDQRGTGGSGAIDCPDLQQGVGPEELALAACARRLGPSYESYRTAAAADDLEAVRQALGYGRLLVYGDSYGTYLAQSFAFRHPDSLRALVLDSAYPVRGESGWFPSTWRTGIRTLATVCKRTARCRPGALGRLSEIRGRLRRAGLGVGPLLTRIAAAGYGPPASYIRIDRAISAYLDGRPHRYRRLTRARPAGSGPARRYSLGLELAVSCNDYPMLWDKRASEPTRREQLEAAIRRYPREAFAPFTPREIALAPDWGYLPCLAWPQPGPHYEPPAEPDAEPPAVPVLVVAGELDNVTSPREAAIAAQLFPGAELRVFRNSGHVYSLYDASSREARRIRNFLRAR